MPTLEHNSLLDVRGRQVPPYLRPRGNWKDSDFLAPYMYIHEEDVVLWPFQIDETLIIRTVVFTNDAVIYAQMATIYGPSTAPFTAVQTDFIEDPTYEYGDAVGNLVVTSDDAVLAVGQAIKGVTVTNGVRVTGYLLRTAMKERLIMTGGPQAVRVDPTGLLMVRSKTAVVEGQVNNMDMYDYTTPIILNEPDYTQAMFNANNQFVVGGRRYIVMGIFAQLDEQV